MQRISVVGSCGSGKTTFARTLAMQLGVRHLELDSVFWEPNWQPRPFEEFRDIASDFVAGDAWVIDGNYSGGRLRERFLSRATTVIWLNYSFPLTFARLWKRTVRRVSRREALWGGNYETARMAFCSRDSILWHMTKNYRRRLRQYRELFSSELYPHLQCIELRHPHEAELLLKRSAETTFAKS